ncbi:unnamed protein product [Parnassius mnemosyne]|uniref:Guanylate cyclase n=1 Tax=Parnassius mnemosyne TaxID=213953 RepID=A0AAV1M2C7_9NEOP
MRRLLLLLAAAAAAPTAPSTPSTPATPSNPAAPARFSTPGTSAAPQEAPAQDFIPTGTVDPVVPMLLVLRSACDARDPSFFNSSALQSYALAAGRALTLRGPFRILSYNETCGPGWRLWVTRGILGALGAGEAAVCAGRGRAGVGAGECGALAAAARALRTPQPSACAAAAARAAAVALLATRLHWRRVLLPPSAQGGECATAMLAVALELTAAGLLVSRAPLSHYKHDHHSHAVILCSSNVDSLRWLHGGASAPAVLLLHLALDDDLTVIHDAHVPLDIRNQNSVSTLELVHTAVGQLPHFENLSNNIYTSSPVTESTIDQYYERDKLDSLQKTKAIIKRNKINSSLYHNFKKSNGKGVIEKKSRLFLVRRRRQSSGSRRLRRSVNSEWLNNANGVRPLILSDVSLEFESKTYSPNTIYDEVLDAVERYVEAAKTRIEISRQTYFLYESATDLRTWTPVVTLATSSVRSLDSFEDWVTVVNVIDPGGKFGRWSTALAERSNIGSGVVGVASALGVCGTLALVVGGALAARRAVRRQRPQGAPVLSVGDFAFPGEELRVGDGMQSMVSCWLQQLHEFGGPHPAHSPRRTSAPSSTCSVSRLPPDRRTRYKGDPVHMKYLPVAGSLELKRKAVDVLLVMQGLRHENLNPFIGCLAEARPALVFEACGRGSLEDVLVADDIRLDWTFRLSLLTDLVRGMRYLHASPLRAHGRLSSRNCAVDSRWVLRVSDYGLPPFAQAQGLPLPHRSARELLWTAPELLRESRGAGRGSPAGDVFSFGIIMQEVIVRGEPYCMLALTPDEIVEKLCRPPPLIRPSVSMGAAPPEAVGVMRQCWSEAADLRPDFNRLYDVFRHMHRGRKINIVDSMFEMLEKYSNNLEELIKERTEQLDMEKKKTEQLLNRMLPRSVAERLMLGSRVEPEEFEEVSIYFSDIVGFTELAARSTPVQVVDLLNDLYTTFDAAIEQYRVYKVETIGDAYMVVGGLPVRAHDHAESVATMALHLLHLAGRFRVRHLPAQPLHLRIGLHSGPCCAGVVGLTMPRYCLFGDTVNTASRMESTGAAWRIQVSAATAARLAAAGGYRLRSRGLRHIKGKGAMHTYWLLGKDGFDRPLPVPPPLQSEEVLFESDGENDSERSCAEAAPLLDQPSAVFTAEEDSIVKVECSLVCEYTQCRMWWCTEAGGARAGRAAWARSGAASADSSPPRTAHLAHPRYRCLAGSTRSLRRQWSLERGDVLAAAAAAAADAGDAGHVGGAGQVVGEPLALRVPPPRAPLARYRTRPEPPLPEDARVS